ncbi:MAG: hypothetical protein MK101_05150 [Phycisphaerales bacterium]|nr:hypothetical protein [Phycisphaerales bacterium]
MRLQPHLSFAACVGAPALLAVLLGGCAWVPDRQPGLQRLSQFAPSAQGHASIGADGRDRMFVVWDSRRQQGGHYGVMGRFVHADGTPASDEFTVNTTIDDHQMHPALAMAQDGSAWVVWQSWLQDGDGWGVVGRFFDGDSWSEELALNERRVGHQQQPVIAVNESGRALAVWVGADDRLHGRLLTPEGPVGSAFTITTGPGAHAVPAIAAVGDDFMLAFAHRSDAGALSVRRARVDTSGGVSDRAIVTLEAIEPAIASNDSDAAIAWLQRGKFGWDVALQQPGLAKSVVVARSTPGHSLKAPALALSKSGRVDVAWSIDKPVHDVMTRSISPEGELGPVERLAHGAHLEAVRGTNRLHLAANGTIHAALSGKAGGDKNSAALASSGIAGDAKWPHLALPPPDLGYGLMLAQSPIPPVWDPEFKPVPRDREARPLRGDWGFEGMNHTGWNPPDPDLAAGPEHVVEVTNGGIAAFTHGGELLWQDEIENPSGFWGSVGATYFVFDPEALYDQRSGRFFVMANERSDGGGSYFLLGVSSTSDPTDPWHKYRFNMSHIDNDIDSPNMAVGDEAVYLGCDMFGPDKYPILMVPKAQVLAGMPVSGETEIMLSGSGNQSLGMVRSTDVEPDVPQYMLQSSEGTGNGVGFNEIRIHAIRDPLGDPYRETYDLTVPTYSYPSQVPQEGTSTQHYLFEPRFWSCVWRNGSIWAVHHVNSSRARVRWYEIDVRGWPSSGQTPVLAQSGEIDQGSGHYSFFPSIAVDEHDNAAIVFARGASDEYTSMWRAVRRASDPANTFQAPELVRSSSAAETSGRWGDYSGASPEVGGGAFWLAHEWRPSSGWSTWIDRVSIGVPQTVQVPGDYATIQEAVDAVVNGSTIEVAPGVYAGPIDLGGRSLTLLGAGIGESVIDGLNEWLVLDLDETGSDMRIEGFTITRGQAVFGGGAFVRGTPIIRQCAFEHCTATGGGAILSALAPGPIVQDCSFCANSPDDINGPWQDGGGNVFNMHCDGDCPGDVDGDGLVGVKDLLLVLADWDGAGIGDVNGDGIVDVNDILFVVGAWGGC